MVDENSQNIDEIINEVVEDVSPPSPVADIPEAAPVNPHAAPSAMPEPTPVKRGRGRPRKNPEAAPAPKAEKPKLVGVPDSTVTAPVDPANAAIEPCAELCVMMTNSVGMMLGGEEAAMRQNEILLAKSGFVGYFKAKGVTDVPPWVLLFGGIAPYAVRVTTTTPAKTTISNGFGRAWFRVKEYFKGRKNARFNRRNDTQRENDTGEAPGQNSGA